MADLLPTLADLVASRLKAAGVRMLFGVPGGGGNLDLIEAGRRARLPFVLTATETAGAIAALAQSEVTGAPGVCLTTLGPGAASVVNGVACAFLDRAPLVVFTDCGAEPYEHQRLDQLSLFESITTWRGRVDRADPLAAIREALAAICMSAGPVHIDCPSDIWSTQVEDTRQPVVKSIITTSEDRRVLELAAKSRRPLVIVGLGARRAEDVSAIRRLCETRGLPAMVTYKAKGVVPDDHAWFAGVFTNGALERPLVEESDLLIGIGLDPVELLPRPWIGRATTIGVSRCRYADDQIPFEAQAVPPGRDLSALVDRIAESLPASTWDPTHVRAEVERQRGALRAADGSGLTPDAVVEQTARYFAADSRVSIDAGAHMFPATMLWPVREPNGLLISNGLSTMGFALPAAVGAALADRSKPVVALTGDGGLLMCAGELLTAAREQLRIVVIVFNDSTLSLIDIKQQARKLPPSGVALGSVDWTRIAAGFGVTPFAAATPSEFESALERASECDGPVLIDVKVDKSGYGEILKRVRG